MMNPQLPYQREPSPYILEAKTTLENALRMSQMARDGELLMAVSSKKGHGFNKNGAAQNTCVYRGVYFMVLLASIVISNIAEI